MITPAWLPVNDRASWPRLPTAIASSAIEIRSPAVSSMSSSRGGGSGETCSARSISSSVVSPIAETTTTTSLPARLASTIRWATRLMPSASATEEPPYFCTTMPTGSLLVLGGGPGSRASTLPARTARRRAVARRPSESHEPLGVARPASPPPRRPARSRSRRRAGRGTTTDCSASGRRSPRCPRRRRRRTATTTAPRPPPAL